MKLAYCYYLQTSRSDAFIDALLAEANELHLFDFSPLRQVYRGGSCDTGARRTSLEARSTQQCKLTAHVCPAVSFGTTGISKDVSVVCSALLAVLWALAIPFQLAQAQSERILFYNGHPLFLAALCYARAKQLKIHTDLGDVLYLVDNPRPWLRNLELAYLNRSDNISCVSRPFRDFLVETLGYQRDTISVISAAIPEAFPEAFDAIRNAERSEALRERLGAKPEALVLGYAGFRWFRHVDGKGVIDVQGVDGLCEAVQWLNDNGKPTHLVIIGAPENDPSLQRFTEGQWAEHFHVSGRYQPLDARHCELLGGADMLVIPSAGSRIYELYDRFKMYEYLAAGKTVVAADRPINHEVYGEHAIYFDDGDWQSMAEAIDVQHERRDGFTPELNQRAAENYSWQKRQQQRVIARAVFEGEPVEAC